MIVFAILTEVNIVGVHGSTIELQVNLLEYRLGKLLIKRIEAAMTTFGRMVRLIFVITLACYGVANASEPERVSANSVVKQADDIKHKVEQEQLQKARDATKQTQVREQKVLKRQESAEWQTEQRLKAQQQFKQRESREQKYLREAREAASKDRKIPTP